MDKAMVENESIVIINDTGLNVEYTINIDGNKTKVVSNDRKSIYPILQTDKDIFLKIRKEDIWQEKHWTNVLLLVIYSFDLVFGNLAEEENLPFFIDYTDNFKLNKGEIKTIFLSEIIKVHNQSLIAWKVMSNIQIVEIGLTILIVGFVLSFIFSGWIRMIFCFCILLIATSIYILAKRRRKNLIQIMNQFMDS